MRKVSGIVAMLAAGTLFAGTVELLPAGATKQLPAGCTAHIADTRGGTPTLNPDITVPCGKPVRIAQDAPLAWLEKPGFITSLFAIPPEGPSLIGPFAAAGDLHLPAGESRNGERLVILSLEADGTQPLFRKVIAGEPATRHVQMPLGRAVAVQLDRTANALAVSRPVTVAKGRAAELQFQKPDAGGDLVLLLRRPRNASPEHPDRVRLAIMDTTRNREPDVFASAGDLVLAVWYGLPGRMATLDVQSDVLRLPTAGLAIAPRTATIALSALQFLPTLTVSIGALPDDVPRPERMSLNVTENGAADVALRALSVEPGKSYRLEHLPPKPLLVALSIDGFKLGERIDLSAGLDREIDIRLEPIIVSGVVYLGNEPARAEIRFVQGRDPMTAATDERGRYRAMLWRPGRLFVDTVLLDKPSVPPFRQMLSIESSGTLDIRIPAMRFAARVYDRDRTKPIENATIIVRNEYVDTATGARGSTVLSYRSTDAAVTELPPQRNGTSQLRVQADGYGEGGPVTVAIDDTPERIVDIPMVRLGDVVAVELRLPSGGPAAGAEVTSWAGAVETWRGTADGSGIARVPKSVASQLFLVRHPAAASRAFTLEASREAASVQLTAAAGPLVVQIRRSDGTPEGPRPLHLTVWIEGRAFSGSQLGFFAWSSGMSSSQGSWMGKNLPAMPLKIVASGRASLAASAGAVHEAFAVNVPYPWPAQVILLPTD